MPRTLGNRRATTAPRSSIPGMEDKYGDVLWVALALAVGAISNLLWHYLGPGLPS